MRQTCSRHNTIGVQQKTSPVKKEITRCCNFLWIVSFILFIGCSTQTKQVNPWDNAPEILKLINEPVFPDTVLNITTFGAIGDGIQLNTVAINNAIRECHKLGGGTVLIPNGVFYTGAIHLLSNVRLHLSDSAEVKFSVNPKDYLPLVYTRWEGIDCFNYSPLIYANGQENIAITGKGILNGCATNSNWWPWKGKTEYGWTEGQVSQLMPHARPSLDSMNKKQVAVENRIMGEGFYLRPQFINLVNCKGILLSDFTISNSPFWIIHPLLSENIIVRGLKVFSLGPNNDGCDPESCKNMLIENCRFVTGDDCIAVKSGRNTDGIVKNIPSKNIIIRNCKMENGHGGVVIGSEISGGARNIYVENCEMDSPELDRAIRIKTNSNRSGIIENLYVRNIKVGEVKESILRINLTYDIKAEGTDTLYPTVRNIFLDNIICNKSKYGLFIDGLEGHDLIYNVQLSNCNFKGVEKGNSIEFARSIVFTNVTLNDKAFDTN